MEKLETVISGYKNLFLETGRIEFFMTYRGLEKLNNNLAKSEDLQVENSGNLSL